MSSRAFNWKDGVPPVIEAHTEARHRVVTKYLRHYIGVVSQFGYRRNSLDLTLVDGFAGGGAFRTQSGGALVDGSPLQLIQLVNEERAAITANNPNFNLNVDYIFVEKDADAVEFLNSVLITRHGKQLLRRNGGPACILHEPYTRDVSRRIIAHVRSRSKAGRCIFLLDPTGYKDLGDFYSHFHYIMTSLPYPEILFTFQEDWFLHFIGQNADNPRVLKMLKDMGILDPTLEHFRCAQHDNDEASISIRRAAQMAMYDKFLDGRFPFFTPFCIKCTTSHKFYVLVHLAKHVRAHDVMVEKHHEMSNHFRHEGRPGLNMLGFDPDDFPANSYGNYLFDEASSQNSIATMTLQLVRDEIIGAMPRSLDGLYASICNSTPATKRMVTEAVRILNAEGEVILKNPDTGKTGGAVQGDTEICAAGRKLFSLPPICGNSVVALLEKQKTRSKKAARGSPRCAGESEDPEPDLGF